MASILNCDNIEEPISLINISDISIDKIVKLDNKCYDVDNIIDYLYEINKDDIQHVLKLESHILWNDIEAAKTFITDLRSKNIGEEYLDKFNIIYTKIFTELLPETIKILQEIEVKYKLFRWLLICSKLAERRVRGTIKVELLDEDSILTETTRIVSATKKKIETSKNILYNAACSLNDYFEYGPEHEFQFTINDHKRIISVLVIKLYTIFQNIGIPKSEVKKFYNIDIFNEGSGFCMNEMSKWLFNTCKNINKYIDIPSNLYSLDVLKTTDLDKYTNIILNKLKTIIDILEGTSGGNRDSSTYYKQKYLKYKLKYLRLKKN